MIKYLRASMSGRKSLFVLVVIEVSVHDFLVLQSLCMIRQSLMVQEHNEGSVAPHEKRKGPRSQHPLEGYSPNGLTSFH
jgi:hypothetical protein